ncbi:MAG: tetratricopeptide repeat protein [Leptospirales bacterium]
MVRTVFRILSGAIPGLLLLSGLGCAFLSPSPDSGESLSRSFSQNLAAGRVVRARADLSSLLKRNPHDFAAWNNLAYLDFRQSNYTRAEGDLDQALALNPGNPFLRLNKARLLLAETRYSEARSLLLSLEPLHPWPKGFRLLLAIADLHTGHQESARLLLMEILNARPSDTMAHAYLSRIPQVGNNG